MSDIIFLSPSNVSLLTAECKALLSNLWVEIIDEDLQQKTSGNDTVFFGRYNNWLAAPQGTPKIRRIDTDGNETVLFSGSDYTIDLAAGEVTLSSGAGTDIIRADYFYAPLNDTLLERLLAIAVKEVEVLIHRTIDDNNIIRDYKSAVCKRFYSNVLKNLLIESRNFFSVSVGDRTIGREQIVSHLKEIKAQNEEDLMLEVNQLRHFNKSNRFS